MRHGENLLCTRVSLPASQTTAIPDLESEQASRARGAPMLLRT